MIDVVLYVASVVLFAIAGVRLWQFQRGLGSLLLVGLGVMELPILFIRLLLILEDRSSIFSMFLVSWLSFLSDLGLILIAVVLYLFIRRSLAPRSQP